jgi:hypothetical protein
MAKMKLTEPVNLLEQSLKSLANLTNDKRLYDRCSDLLFQLWNGEKFGIKKELDFLDLVEFNWLKHRKRIAQQKGLKIIK